ncbi:40S ribosomal protein S13-2, putative [Entamoeba invadens IP1]|nr:40S ribosomal protein S13-2, putative [Entamoeba invadens IP1]ELP94246.1 40S ribosomal protein S13-2, putative [Entamoeba invadens IP1]|eukprot:XP_004261017.1 40S ribosomal protein S13-2, putative [Entamoeba invadens IP1]
MYSRGKGISRRCIPYRRTAPAWQKKTSLEVIEEMCKLAKKGMPPSQIGAYLRDVEAIGLVKSITGSKVLRILKLAGLAPKLPEDLYFLMKRAVSIRKHLERNKKDKISKYHLILTESKIHRLVRYYKTTKVVDSSFKYDANTASAIVS